MTQNEQYAFNKVISHLDHYLNTIHNKSLSLLVFNFLLFFITFFLFETLPLYFHTMSFKQLAPFILTLIFAGLFISTLYAVRAIFIFLRMGDQKISSSFFFFETLSHMDLKDIKNRFSEITKEELIDNLSAKTQFLSQKLDLKSLNLSKSYFWFFLFVLLPYFTLFLLKILEFFIL